MLYDERNGICRIHKRPYKTSHAICIKEPEQISLLFELVWSKEERKKNVQKERKQAEFFYSLLLLHINEFFKKHTKTHSFGGFRFFHSFWNSLRRMKYTCSIIIFIALAAPQYFIQTTTTTNKQQRQHQCAAI